jgi:hypothetical protein
MMDTEDLVIYGLFNEVEHAEADQYCSNELTSVQFNVSVLGRAPQDEERCKHEQVGRRTETPSQKALSLSCRSM